MKQALIVIDVQNDYFPGGAMELSGIVEAAKNCAILIDRFRQTDKSIFHIKHVATRPGATFFLPNTDGSRIHSTVEPAENEDVVIKHYPNSFRETRLAELLKQNGIEEVIICGAMTHMCIDTTTRAAFDLGFNCCVIHDACATRDLIFNNKMIKAVEVHHAFMAALSAPFAKVLSTEEFLATK